MGQVRSMRLAPHGVICYHSEVGGSDGGGTDSVEKQGGVIRGARAGLTPSSDISVFLIHSGSAESKGLALQS